MRSQKVLAAMNISLALIAILLLLHLFGLRFPSLGQAFVSLDKTSPLCVVQWQQEFTPWNDYDRCCLEARRQLECSREEQQLAAGAVQWHCATGAGNVPTIWLNSKVYAYCREQPFW